MSEISIALSVRDLRVADLPSCGIGTLLIRSAERRITARGPARAELAYGREPDSRGLVTGDHP